MKYAILNGQKVFRVDLNHSEVSIACPDEVEAGWLYQNSEFIPPPGSLAYAKKRAKETINNIRNYKLSLPVIYDNNYYDADTRSQFNLASIVSAGNVNIPLPNNFMWRTSDNQNIPFNRQQLVELSATMINNTNTIYQESWQKKALIDAATTVEEVENITWN
jgi:hypothetical protein